MAPNHLSSSRPRRITIEKNKNGVKQICLSRPSKDGKERALPHSGRVRVPSDPKSSEYRDIGRETMGTAPENPFATPTIIVKPASMRSETGSSRDNVSPSLSHNAKQQKDWYADYSQEPSPRSIPEEKRTSRLRADSLPFFLKPFLQYHHAQKAYDKKKEKEKTGKDK